MPDQRLDKPFVDQYAVGIAGRDPNTLSRVVYVALPMVVSISVGSILVFAFQADGVLTSLELFLTCMMTLLAGWEAFPSANALLGWKAVPKDKGTNAGTVQTIAILVTMRDEGAEIVLPEKLKLLQSLRYTSRYRFSLHVLSDSTVPQHVNDERNMIRSVFPLPVYHYTRMSNLDFKAGNIRRWIRTHGADYDAFITLDADSELSADCALNLADALAADSACGLIQTVPQVLPGRTRWQNMQSVASRIYGAVQGKGLATWMGDEANYYGHNAIIRTTAFATCAGLPQLEGQGLWKGTILSHDFVEAALLRRAGWGVRLLPKATGSFEQAPRDLISHIKRDARWCQGNFQHSLLLSTAGFHAASRLHLVSGIFTYLSSVLWLVTLVLWAMLDNSQSGAGGILAATAFLLITLNLMFPRILGTIRQSLDHPRHKWAIIKDAIFETVFSSLFAPGLMLQRVLMIARIFANKRITWAPHDKGDRSALEFVMRHAMEALCGLFLLALIERGLLTLWFLPIAVCLAATPLLSWFSAQTVATAAHEKLNASTPL